MSKIECGFEKMGGRELSKAGFLLTTAHHLGMDLSGYGQLSVNPHSGNTYLWLEDYSFCLYLPITTELKIKKVQAVIDCGNCGY